MDRKPKKTSGPRVIDRPSVAVDVALVTTEDDALFTVVVPRETPPHRGRFALPGTFVHIDESLEDAAHRALRDKVGAFRVYLEQLYTFGAPKRDPRERVITVAYYALVARDRLVLSKGAEPARLAKIEVPWEGETGGPVVCRDATGREAGREMELDLAFDHADILGMAVKRLRGKLGYSPIGFQLLPERFTLLDLQRVHETISGMPLNKDSFRRKMLASGQLEATGELQQDVGHRPAELYRFARRSAI